jgi:D-lactate dehydrogenase
MAPADSDSFNRTTGRGLDVFFYEAFEEEAEAIRRYLPEGLSAGFTWRTIQEDAASSRSEADPPARVVSTRTQSVFPSEWADKVEGIFTRSAGFDHVRAYRRACGRDIPAGYLPSYCSRAVAEHAMLLWTALLRNLPRQLGQFERFCRDGITGRECLGRTALVVGVGSIGGEIVKVAQGLGMTVLGVDLVARHDFVEYVEYDEGLPRADVIVCAMNLTSVNAGYFSYGRLEGAKSGAVFVNIARGELAPAAGLLRLLKDGRLAGVGLDVYEDEGELAVMLRECKRTARPAVAATLELARRDDVIATPHNAFNTAEAVERKARMSVEAIAEFLQGGAFPEPVPADE